MESISKKDNIVGPKYLNYLFELSFCFSENQRTEKKKTAQDSQAIEMHKCH